MTRYDSLLQNVTDIVKKCDNYFITKCDRSLLQNASGFLLQNLTVLLQNVTVITKCDVYYKLRQYTDHIMTLFTLIKKFLRERKYLYKCFVDFKKAYISICRQRLIYKLKEFGLTGNKLEIIKTTYATPNVSLLYEGKISQSFNTKIGLKQGDVLGTFLFNLYINNLPDVLNKESDSKEDQLHIPKLDSITINNLLFAADLTILYWSKYDLQKKISNLENYCEKRGLELKLYKTKVLIFNKQRSTVKKYKFYFQGKEKRIVKQNTYLGFTFILLGKKHKDIENILKTASKA